MKHPWVDGIEEIRVEPPAVVKVRLRFRSPILSVTTEGGTVRLVDASGVLLPVSPAPTSIPELVNRLPSPDTPAGQVWADETVRTVELVSAYHPRRLEKSTTGWRFTQNDGKTCQWE